MHDRQLRSLDPRIVSGWGSGADDTVTAADLRSFFLRRRLTIVLPLVAALLAAYGYMRVATPVYTARAQVIIDPRQPQFLPGRRVDSVLAWDSAQVESEIAVLQSERIASMVVTKLGLDKADDFRGPPSLWSDLMARVIGTEPRVPTGDRFREALSTIERQLNVRRTGLSYAIDITFSFPDARRAQEVANAIAEAYILDQLENRSQAARVGGEWLQQRMVSLRSQMNAAAQAAQAFRASHDYTIPKPRPADAAARDATAPDPASVALPPGTKTLDELEAAAATYRRVYESFLQSYTESVQRQSFPVTDAHILTPANLPLVRSSPRGMLIYSLAVLIGCLAGFGLAIIRHHMDGSITAQDQITERVGIDGLGTLPLLRPRLRFSPSAAIAKLFGHRPRSDRVDDVRRRMGRDRSWSPLRPPPFFTAVLDPHHAAFGRAMMTVKVFLDLVRDKRLGCVGVTAARRGAGSSMLASNLGLLYAECGASTLVVDADFGRAALTRAVDAGGGPGLAEILGGWAELKEAVVPFAGTRLDFLPAAAPRARPAGDHLLSSKAMASFLREAGQLYDIVIVDLPPALPIGGVLALSPALDGLVVAIEADKTQMDLIVTLSDHFSRARAKVFGFAITKAAKPARA